jgi:pimeloyl-ACP methyl ester carboxylesterase
MIALSDGTALHVEVEGGPAAPVTVVLAHGWTVDARTWGPVASALAGPGARVVRYDHRGHGRSSAVDPATMTLDQLADDLAELVAAVAPTGPLVLAGHSMGGMTIMALAERHPDVVARTAGVGLVATAAGGLADTSFGLPAATVPVLRAVEERVYGSRHWGRAPQLGSPRALTRRCAGCCSAPTPTARPSASPSTRWPPAGRSRSRGSGPTLAAHERDAALAGLRRGPDGGAGRGAGPAHAGVRRASDPQRAARRRADDLLRGRAHAAGGAGGRGGRAPGRPGPGASRSRAA